MSAMLTVARREIAERKLVLAAGAATGVLALLAPLLPAWSSWEAHELIVATSGTLASILGFALAAILGGSILSRELADGRLGFYLSRPLSPLAVWGGKMLAAAALALGAALLAALPALVASLGVLGGADGLWWSLPLAVGLPALAIVIVVGIAHAVSVMARSRSPWLAADLSAGVVFVSVTLWLVGVLRSLGVQTTLSWPVWATVTLCALAFFVAGAISTSRGRCSARQTHRALTLCLWIFVAVSVIGLGAWTAWINSTGPRDLTRVDDVQPAPRGPWAAVSGYARLRGDYVPQFLVNLETGSWLRTTAGIYSEVLFSRDGSRATWFGREEDERGRIFRLMWANLRTAAPRAEATSVLLDQPSMNAISDITLDDQGDRAALVCGGNVSVVRLPSGDQVGAARLPIEHAFWTAAFVGTWVELVGYRWEPQEKDSEQGPGTLALYDYNPESRSLERRWSIELEPHKKHAFYRMDREHDHMLLAVRYGERRVVTLLQASTGATVATLHDHPSGGSGRFLADGRIVIAGGDGSRSAVTVYAPSGERLRELNLPEGHWTTFGCEVMPGQLTASIARRVKGEIGWRRDAVLIDVDGGSVRELGEDLKPALRWWGTPTSQPQAGSPGAQLLLSGNDALVRLDPETAALEPILGRYAPEEERP